MPLTNRELLQRILLEDRLLRSIEKLDDGDFMFLSYITDGSKTTLGKIIECAEFPEGGILSDHSRADQAEYQEAYWRFIEQEYGRVKAQFKIPTDADKVVLTIYRRTLPETNEDAVAFNSEDELASSSRTENDIAFRQVGFEPSYFSTGISLRYALLLYNLSREYDNSMLVFCDEAGEGLVSLTTLRETSPIYQRDDFFAKMFATQSKEFFSFVRDKPPGDPTESFDDTIFEKSNLYLDRDQKTIIE